jgi:hypothetical protein
LIGHVAGDAIGNRERQLVLNLTSVLERIHARGHEFDAERVEFANAGFETD